MLSKFHTTTAGVGLAVAGALALVLLVSGAVGYRLGTGAWPDWVALTGGGLSTSAEHGEMSAAVPSVTRCVLAAMAESVVIDSRRAFEKKLSPTQTDS